MRSACSLQREMRARTRLFLRARGKSLEGLYAHCSEPLASLGLGRLLEVIVRRLLHRFAVVGDSSISIALLLVATATTQVRAGGLCFLGNSLVEVRKRLVKPA